MSFSFFQKCVTCYMVALVSSPALDSHCTKDTNDYIQQARPWNHVQVTSEAPGMAFLNHFIIGMFGLTHS